MAKFAVYVTVPIGLMYFFANTTQNLQKFMGAHFQRDIVRGVEGFVSESKKQLEIARKLAENCCKYGTETQSGGSPLARAALQFGVEETIVGHADPLGGDFPLVIREGHNVLDVIFTSSIVNLADVAESLDKIDGVVEHGVFAKTPCTVVIATEDGMHIVDNTVKSEVSGLQYQRNCEADY